MELEQTSWTYSIQSLFKKGQDFWDTQYYSLEQGTVWRLRGLLQPGGQAQRVQGRLGDEGPEL